ncbi:hypothetical protein F4604DRAFT_1593555, partial [Suillus subluteus]
LDQCPVGHPHQAATLTNLVWACLESYIQNGLRDIDFITSLFRGALAFRLQGHPDHPLSIYHLLKALIRRFSEEKSLPYVFMSSRNSSSTRPPGNPYRDNTINNLALALKTRYDKLDTSEDLDETINLFKDSLQLRPHGHPCRHITIFSLSSAICDLFSFHAYSEE